MQLGRVDEPAQSIAFRGGSRLAAAGRRALARGDMPAAVNLLERASVASRRRWSATGLRRRRSRDRAPRARRPAGGGECARQGRRGSRRGRRRGAGRASTARADDGAHVSSIPTSTSRMPSLEAHRGASRSSRQAGDEAGTGESVAARCSMCGGSACGSARRSRPGARARACTQCRRPAKGSEILGSLCRVAQLGPTPVEEAIRRCRAILEEEPENLVLTAEVQEVAVRASGRAGRVRGGARVEEQERGA